jgi:L-ascorbate metabolism protein UlaG (beta-lactamase superfamily)
MLCAQETPVADPAPAEPIPTAPAVGNPVPNENEKEGGLRIVEEGDPVKLPDPQAPADPEPGKLNGKPATTVSWYGHAFVYVTSSTGVRIALDPFGKEMVTYSFPPRLPADLVLVSNEGDDHSAAERLFGSPQVFRSITAVGVNRANGLLFKGVEVMRQSRKVQGASRATAFVFSLDGVTFGHFGAIGDILDFNQRQALGRVDVLFLAVGDQDLPVNDLNRIVADLGAKIIVPIKYRTGSTGNLRLRPLDDFIRDQTIPVKEVETNQFKVNRESLPPQPAILVLRPAVPTA